MAGICGFLVSHRSVTGERPQPATSVPLLERVDTPLALQTQSAASEATASSPPSWWRGGAIPDRFPVIGLVNAYPFLQQDRLNISPPQSASERRTSRHYYPERP